MATQCALCASSSINVSVSVLILQGDKGFAGPNGSSGAQGIEGDLVSALIN